MAVLTTLSYARTRVRKTHTHQRVRLGAVVSATTGDVYNRTRADGLYGRTGHVNGLLYFAWSAYGAPPIQHEAQVIVGLTEAAFVWDTRGRVLLLSSESGAITERASDDDGFTWNTAATRWGAGSHGEIGIGPDGMILRAAYVAGALQITRQAPGDASPGSPFSAVDSSAVALALQDDRFRLACDRRGIWWLHARISGGTTTILWSSDEGASWTVTDGAVTGLASGTRPGIACGHDGSLIAWVYLAGAAHYSRRLPGDTAWSAFAAMKDDAGVDLAIANQNFSLTHGFEGPDRWLGAWVANGQTSPKDYWSAAEAGSWKVFA